MLVVLLVPTRDYCALSPPESGISFKYGSTDMNLSELIEAYLRHKAAEGAVQSTMDSRRRVLADLARSHAKILASNLKVYDVCDWVLSKKTWSGSMQSKAKKIVRSLFRWADQMGLVPGSPITKIDAGKVAKRRPMLQGEYEAILDKVKRPLRFLLQFMRACGCRPGEAAMAKWTDVNMITREIRLVAHKTAKKTGKPRIIPISDEVRYVLAAMHQHKGKRSPENFIFPTRFGKRWSAKAMSRSFIGARVRAGVDKEVTMHGIRHLYATDAVEKGMNPAVLSRILGHESIETTLRTYVQPKDNITAWLAQMDAIAAERLPDVQTPEYSRRRSARANEK